MKEKNQLASRNPATLLMICFSVARREGEADLGGRSENALLGDRHGAGNDGAFDDGPRASAGRSRWQYCCWRCWWRWFERHGSLAAYAVQSLATAQVLV